MYLTAATLTAAALLSGPLYASDPHSHSTGEVEFACLITPSEQVEVPARDAGPLAQVSVREGVFVSAGEVLAHLDDSQQKLELEQARFEVEISKQQSENDINVRFARAACEVAEAELAQAEGVNHRHAKSIPAAEVRRLALAAKRARLQIEQSERDLAVAAVSTRSKTAAVQIAELKIERRKIVAPRDGVVVEVYRHEGEWVDTSETVLRIVRVDRVRAEALLSADEVRPDLAGKPVVVVASLPGGQQVELPGTITFVSPEIEPTDRKFRVWAEIANPRLELRPGKTAKMRFRLD